MKRRYITRSAWEWSDGDDFISMTSDTIILEDDRPRPSGLYDANGDELYSVREKLPFGFRGREKA